MQRQRRYFERCVAMVMAAAMAVGLLSCSKKGTEPGGEPEVPMAFAPTVDWHSIANTKALINSASDLRDYSISILANATKENSSGGGTTTYPVFKNHRLDYEGSAWTYSPTKYWIPGAEYSFVAFAPFAPTSNSPAGTDGKRTLSNGTFTIGGTDENPILTISDYCTGRVTTGDKPFDARSEDLLRAYAYRNNTSAEDYSPVALNFEHLLACVTFNIRNATSTDILTVSDIKLSGIKHKCDITITPKYCQLADPQGEISLSTNEFTSDNRTATGSTALLPKGMSESEFKPLYDCTDLTVLPQNLYNKEQASLTFTLVYRDSTTEQRILELDKIESIRSWEPGKKYNYNMTITSQDIIFQVVEVPWVEHEVEL